LNALIALLAAGDNLRTLREIDQLKALDPAAQSLWADQAKLIADLIKAIDDEEIDAFSDALYAYDKVYRMDSWKIDIFTKIKGTFKPEEDFT